MAFHYYTGSDISEQREPAFWRREPRWPIGTFDGPDKMAKQEIGHGHDKMAMAGNCQNGNGRSRRQAGKAIVGFGICKENAKNPNGIGQFLTKVKIP